MSTQANNIAAIILAAGNGKRIGQPKWQLEINGQSFLEIIIQNLHNATVTNIVCVVNKFSMPQVEYCDFTINQRPENGMLSSVHCGVNYALQRWGSSVAGYMIFPVDHPAVTCATIVTMCQQFCSIKQLNGNEEFALMPTYQGKTGHPVIISRASAANIPAVDYPGGLKSFLMMRQVTSFQVQVNDVGILRNVNTKDDLAIFAR